MGNHWTLQDAQSSFSAVVDAAQRGEPQHVGAEGGDAVVVLSAEEYVRLTGVKPSPSSAEAFKQHLLNFPKLPEGMDDMFEKREPMIVEMNTIDFRD